MSSAPLNNPSRKRKSNRTSDDSGGVRARISRVTKKGAVLSADTDKTLPVRVDVLSKDSDAGTNSTLGNVRATGMRILRGAKDLAIQTAQLPGSTAKVAKAFVPLTSLLGGETHITDERFSQELDRIFEALYEHPLTEQTRRITTYLRSRNVLPNEGSTESLIRYVLNESVARSRSPFRSKSSTSSGHFSMN